MQNIVFKKGCTKFEVQTRSGTIIQANWLCKWQTVEIFQG